MTQVRSLPYTRPLSSLVVQCPLSPAAGVGHQIWPAAIALALFMRSEGESWHANPLVGVRAQRAQPGAQCKPTSACTPDAHPATTHEVVKHASCAPSDAPVLPSQLRVLELGAGIGLPGWASTSNQWSRALWPLGSAAA